MTPEEHTKVLSALVKASWRAPDNSPEDFDLEEACGIMSKEPTTGYNVYLDGVHIPDDVVKKAVFFYMSSSLNRDAISFQYS